MINTSKFFTCRKRRGISTIIGAFFFIVVMVAAFGAILTAMSLQSQLVEQQAFLAKQSVQTIQENFTIEPFCAFPNLGVLVKNVGTNALQVATVWYVEQSGPDFAEEPIDVSLQHRYVPPGSTVDVLSDKFILLGPLTGMYTIKVVTMLGNILESEFNADCPLGDDDPLEDELVARPAVYVAFPNPWNKSADYGYFAIIVVNPTANPMTVYRTSLTLVSATNPQSFGSGTKSVPNPPGTDPWGGAWYESVDSIWWESDEITNSLPLGTEIVPYSAKEFIASAKATNSIGMSPVNTVNTNTLTSFGQFGGIKIDTIGTFDKDFAVPNIFFVADGVSTTPSYYIHNSLEISSLTFYVALHNSSDKEPIDKDTKLVINIPAAFEIVNANQLLDGFDAPPNQPVEITFDDNSHQLTYNLTNDLAPGGYARVQLTVTTPDLSTDSVYIFHTYAYGSTSDTPQGPGDPDTILIGPVAEFAVRICKVGDCQFP